MWRTLVYLAFIIGLTDKYSHINNFGKFYKEFWQISKLILAIYSHCGIIYIGEQKKYPIESDTKGYNCHEHFNIN